MTSENQSEKGFKPSKAQKGAFLIALGKQMLLANLTAGAALDGLSAVNIKQDMQAHGVDGEIAEQILALELDTLAEAIDESF